LSRDAVAHLPATIARPQYDRAAQKEGIVHFGIGAFHRAHQAWYTDAAMNAGDRDWGIIGVSLRSADVAKQMNPQNGLYSLSERSGDGVALRTIGSVQRVLVAAQEAQSVVAALASPDTHIVSFTITEKGYCRASDGSLDLALADEASVYAFLAQGMKARRDAGLPGLTLLSCDNLANNGAQLERLMTEYLTAYAPDLRDWFAKECTCPSTMVDRIVPATTIEDRAAVSEALGMSDEAAVVTEPFSQWVIEDRFAGPRPRWEVGGAQLTSDVQAYETAKLRMLNGAHSALAYLGLERGHVYVHQAIADPALHPLIDTLMRDEAATSLTPALGQDLNAYAYTLLTRFANPALNHKLIQIAMDGSQKIPQRWLETLAHHQREGRPCPAILTALAAWVKYVRGDDHAVNDPMAAQLAALWRTAGQDGIVNALFGTQGVFAAYYVAGDDAQIMLQQWLNAKDDI
jgi:fructuronate reductase